MTLGLSYNDDLSRVQISITDLPFSTGTARIERSTNQLYWQTVRGATALPVVGGAAVVDDFEFTADVPNYYRVVTDAPAGLYLPGTAGSYASTPDTAALDLTGNFEIEADVDIPNLATGSTQAVVSKYLGSGGNRSYAMWVSGAGQMQAVWSTDGTNAGRSIVTSATAIPSTAVGLRVGVDVDSGDDHTVYFSWRSSDAAAWSVFDTQVISGTTSVHAGAAALEVGAHSGGTADVLAGTVRAIRVRSDIGGTAIVDASFNGQSTGATSFTDDVGLTWTVHGDAGIVGDVLEEGSVTPSLDGHAWLKSIRHPFLNRPIHRTLAGGGQSIGRASRGALHEVQGRSVPVAVTDVRSSREFTLTVQVPDEAAARDMDLTLASGDVFFLQVPPELAPHMTGGYVTIGDTTQHREADTIRWRFTLPCKVVAPPGPGIVGTTMTWGGVFRLYGSWEALIASNPTWGDLLATVGSPDDLVVL